MKIKIMMVVIVALLSSTLYADAFSPKAAPDAPILEYPVEITVNTHAPSFGWAGFNFGGTYKLVVKDPQGVKVWSKKYNDEDICMSGFCTASPGGEIEWVLANGKDFKWKVVAKNDDGKANAKSTFTVDSPGAVEIVSPMADDEVSGLDQVIWNEVSIATEYRVVIKQLSGGSFKLKSDWLPATDFCASTCLYELDTDMPVGEYRVKVTSRQTPFSNKSNSKVNFSIVPVIK